MTTPSERVLESWRQNAKEEFWLHQFTGYRQKIINGYGQTLRENWTAAPNYLAQARSFDYGEIERRLSPFVDYYYGSTQRLWCE